MRMIDCILGLEREGSDGDDVIVSFMWRDAKRKINILPSEMFLV